MTVEKLIKELEQCPRRATVETLVDGSLIRKYAKMNHLIGIRCDLRVSGLTTFLERPIRRVVTLVIEKEVMERVMDKKREDAIVDAIDADAERAPCPPAAPHGRRSGGQIMATSKNPIRVTEARRAYGVAATARRLGIHPSQLTYILHGQRKPNDALRRRLARLGITRTVDGKEFGEVE